MSAEFFAWQQKRNTTKGAKGSGKGKVKGGNRHCRAVLPEALFLSLSERTQSLCRGIVAWQSESSDVNVRQDDVTWLRHNIVHEPRDAFVLDSTSRLSHVCEEIAAIAHVMQIGRGAEFPADTMQWLHDVLDEWPERSSDSRPTGRWQKKSRAANGDSDGHNGIDGKIAKATVLFFSQLEGGDSRMRAADDLAKHLEDSLSSRQSIESPAASAGCVAAVGRLNVEPAGSPVVASTLSRRWKRG